MRMMVFKIIAFLSVFIFTQGAILPWAISNTYMPLWADIVLVTIILMMWLAVIDRLAYHLLKILRRDDEAAESID
jgi:ABC-type Fe3+-siderophore transport system permease subunit